MTLYSYHDLMLLFIAINELNAWTQIDVYFLVTLVTLETL